MTFPPTNTLSDTSGGRYGNAMIGYSLVSAPANQPIQVDTYRRLAMTFALA